MPQSKSEIKSAYDSAAPAYAEQFLNELQHKPLDRELLKQFADAVGDKGRVVDIGCGPGHTTAHLASLGVEPVGVDLSTEMIRAANVHFPEQEFTAGDFFDLPFEDDSFAGCLAFYCIVHLQHEQLVDAFAEMRRVLKPNGLLFLSFHVGTESVHNDDFLNSGAALTFFPFPVDAVTRTLATAGFTDIDARVREPYGTEYPSQRCYVLARKA